MNYKNAALVTVEHQPDGLSKLTNPFHFHKIQKPDPNTRVQNLGIAMRKRWEAWHLQHGTWYDYSDLEYSDDDDEDDLEEDFEELVDP